MTAISELIVYLWLVPATLFVILPLSLSILNSLVRAVISLVGLFTDRSLESLDNVAATT